MSLTDEMAFYTTRKSADGNTVTYSVPAWIPIFTFTIAWLAAFVWSIIALVAGIVFAIDKIAGIL